MSTSGTGSAESQQPPSLPPLGQPPTQDRAKATADAIVQAAFEIIADVGYDDATIDRICNRAGVGPASVYRYYPTKEALLSTVLEYAWRREVDDIARALSGADGALADVVAGVTKAAVASAARTARVKSAFLAQIGPFRLHPAAAETSELAVSVLAEALRARSDVLGIEDPEVAAFMLVRGIAFVIHAAAERHPDWLEGEDARLERTLASLIVRMLTRPTVS